MPSAEGVCIAHKKWKLNRNSSFVIMRKQPTQLRSKVGGKPVATWRFNLQPSKIIKPLNFPMSI